MLLRHGESEWNKANLFTGWVDVPLSEKGRVEAARGGQLLAEHGLLPDVLHTSVLKRAIAHRRARAGRGRPAVDPGAAVVAAQRAALRRAAGQGQGRDPRRVRRGAVHDSGAAPTTPRRRRSSPAASTPRTATPRYAFLPPEARPATECLKDVVVRMLPYWYDAIVPDLRSGETVLVAAHGNSLRALVKHLDGMGDDEVVGLNIPTGVPLRYDLDDDLRPRQDRRRVPRPRGRGRRHRGRQEPGQEVAAGGRRRGAPGGAAQA